MAHQQRPKTATRARPAAALIALLLAATLLLPRCGSVTVVAIDAVAVIGVGEQCASRVVGIDLDVMLNGSVELSKHFAIASASTFPFSVDLPVDGSATATHEVKIQFEIAPATAGSAPTYQTVGPIPYTNGASERLVLELPCVCIGVTCPPGETCEEVPHGSGLATCFPPSVCGNGVCEPGEPGACPIDCPPGCGDGVCAPGETCGVCEVDCGKCPICGDGKCDVGETCMSCPDDCGACPPVCDGGACPPVCDGGACPPVCDGGACPPVCGDGKCTAPTETCATCPQDCGCCSSICCNNKCGGGDCSSCPAHCGNCAKCCPNGNPAWCKKHC